MGAWGQFWKRLIAPLLEPAEARSGQGDAVAVAVESAPSGDAAPSENLSAAGCWWIPGSQSVSAPDVSEPVDSALADALERALESGLSDARFELPKLPHVLQQALVMLRGENVDYAALAHLVAEDPTLAAQILRAANSAHYASQTKITALQPAFARLGVRAIRALILGASLQNFSIRVDGGQRSLGEELWRRSLAGGVIVEAAAEFCGVNAADAFLVGLLHNIGDFVVLMIAREECGRLHVKTPRAIIESLALRWHERAGLRLAEAWQLPSPMPELIADHHRLPVGGDPLEKQRLLILFADVVRSLLSIVAFHPYDFFATPCVQRLGIGDTPKARAWLQSLPDLIQERIDGE